MIEDIVRRLKDGSIQNVIPKGYSTTPKAPYVVVAIEGTQLCVWVHYKPGYVIAVERYWGHVLPALLNEFQFETSAGNTIIIKKPRLGELYHEYNRIVLNKAANGLEATISKERRWDIPALRF